MTIISTRTETFQLFIILWCVLSSVYLFATPMDCSLPGSSVHGILQARILEWVAFLSPGDLPWHRDWTVSLALPTVPGRFFLPLAPPRKPIHYPISSPKSVLISCMQACMLSHFSRVWVLWPYGPWSARLLCPWDSPGKNSGVGGHVLLQGIFLIQGLNLPSCVCSIDKQVLYHYHHLESPLISQK